MKLNICFICDEYPPLSHGGIGSVTKTLAEEFVKNGHRVFIVGISAKSQGGENYEKINGVEIWRFKHGIKIPFMRSNNLLYRGLNKVFKFDFWGVEKVWFKQNLFLEKLVKEKSIDVIEFPDFRFCYAHLTTDIFFRFWPNINVLKIAKLHGSLNFLGLESKKNILKKVFLMEQSLLDYCDKIISVSPYTTKRYFSLYNLKPSKTTEIFNGVEIFDNNEVTLNKENFAVFSGSLVKKKGIVELLKAWNIVCLNNESIQLRIYGKGIKQKFVKYINSKYRNRVAFFGHIDQQELYQVYKKAKVAIFPSHTETFGLAPLESMLYGCPTIGSEIFAKTWYKKVDVVNNRFPILIQNHQNINELALVILKVIDDKSLQKSLSKNGRNYARENFDINSFLQRKYS